MKAIYIPELFGEIAEKVDAEMFAEHGFHVHYHHGHPLEIIETLGQYSESQTLRDQKFPLIALFQDFRERRGQDIGVYAELPALNIIIASATMDTYKAQERYEYNFKPILYPIYYSFLRQISLDGRFITGSENLIEHDKWDRLFWGRQDLYGNIANNFNDFIDAIEIENLNLKVNLKNC